MASMAVASALAETSARSAVKSAPTISMSATASTVEKSPTPARERTEEDVFTLEATLT